MRTSVGDGAGPDGVAAESEAVDDGGSSAPRRSSSMPPSSSQAEQVDAAVTGDGPAQLAFVGGLDELVDECCREHVRDPVPGLAAAAPAR